MEVRTWRQRSRFQEPFTPGWQGNRRTQERRRGAPVRQHAWPQPDVTAPKNDLWLPPAMAGRPAAGRAVVRQADFHHPAYAAAKRAFDVAFALTLALVTLPIWLTVALLVRLTSPGPVIFRQARCGEGGKVFMVYKFRTMVDGAEDLLRKDARLAAEFAEGWKLRHDCRVTPIGRWLRKTSIDELPQLLNVLRGEMSVVGPRPVQPRELRERFDVWADTVTAVKPGLTSLWSVSGRSSLSYDERIRLEVEYVRRRSFAYDLWLILLTIPAVLGGRGAM